ncbi:hypothetical protein U1Q18_036228, partial [Sarracenia purpurea var. burkii]
ALLQHSGSKHAIFIVRRGATMVAGLERHCCSIVAASMRDSCGRRAAKMQARHVA